MSSRHLKAYPFMQEVAYTQNKLLIADLKYKDEQPFTLLFTKVSIDLPVCLFPKCMHALWAEAGVPRETTQTQGERTNSTQKRPWTPKDSNLEPSWCKGTILITTHHYHSVQMFYCVLQKLPTYFL